MENLKSIEEITENRDAESLMEIFQGETELKLGNFDRAKDLFSQASNKDPYCWQAYWGMFKASIQAKTNDEIYFSGFLDQLRESETSANVPDYVEYYKSAKYNATAQRSREINFTTIEMGYKKADQANYEFREQVSKLKDTYDSADAENVKSAKGKVACRKLIEINAELVKWKTISNDGNKLNIALMFVGICIINLGLMFTQIDFFANSEIGSILALISMFGPAAFIIWNFMYKLSLIIVGIVTGVLSFLAVTTINELCSNSLIARIAFVAVFLTVGAAITLRYFKQYLDCKNSRVKISKTVDKMQGIMDEVVDAFLEDIAVLYSNPVIVKYKIPFPVDVKINFDNYITKNEEIYEELADFYE